MKVEEAVADGIVLRAPLRVDWSTVAALAVESLAGKVAVQRLELHAAQVDSAPRIVMELEHDDDPCGAVWLTAKPKFDAAKNAIRFTDVAVYPKWNPKRKVGNLTKQLEQYASVPLPVPLVELGNRLNALQSELVPAVDEAQVDITLGPPTVVEIALDEKGLVPIVGLTGSATVLAD
jgi:hypothetical protein